MMRVDYERLPKHIQYGLFRYIEHGNVPGDFLQQVICNRLVHALGQADSTNRECIFDIATFVYNEMPSESWGSQKEMDEWIEAGGAKGKGYKIEHLNGVIEGWRDK